MVGPEIGRSPVSRFPVVLVFPVPDIEPESRIWVLTELNRLIKLDTSQDLVGSIFRVT